MNHQKHPKGKTSTLIMNNGASYSAPWILPNPFQGLEVDPHTNPLWKPYQDSSDLHRAKRITQFQERFGSLGLEEGEKG